MALAGIEDTRTTVGGALDPSVPEAARLSLEPARVKRGGIIGGWWPRSRDAARELPGLIADVNAQAGRVSRVALLVTAFSNIPHRLIVSGRKVHVAWFRYMNVHTILLTMASHDDLVLLVVPPWASAAAAAEVLRLAAAGATGGPPQALLAAAGIATDGDNDMLSWNGAE